MPSKTKKQRKNFAPLYRDGLSITRVQVHSNGVFIQNWHGKIDKLEHLTKELADIQANFEQSVQITLNQNTLKKS